MTRRAASYYEDAADDYYAKEGEASEWQGNGAAELGLSGPVDSARFRELLDGRVTPGEDRRCPKSNDHAIGPPAWSHSDVQEHGAPHLSAPPRRAPLVA